MTLEETLVRVLDKPVSITFLDGSREDSALIRVLNNEEVEFHSPNGIFVGVTDKILWIQKQRSGPGSTILGLLVGATAGAFLGSELSKLTPQERASLGGPQKNPLRTP